MDARWIDEISKRINELIESVPAHEVERNLRALLQGMFAKMDLVTREEFDVQSQVLLQTRNKLKMLERELAELEAKIASGD